MKAGRAIIGIFQKMRIKNLRGRGVSEVRFKKLDSFTLATSKNHLIRNSLRNERVRVKLYAVRRPLCAKTFRGSILRINFGLLNLNFECKRPF